MMRAAALSLGLLLAAAPARAFFGADELKIYSPQVTYGEREIEYIGFAAPDHEQGHAVSVGYAFTPWWAVEAYEVFHQDPETAANPSTKLESDTVELESLFQITSPGRYWADFGLLAEWEIPQRSGDPMELRLTPLIEKQFGDALVTLNLPLERQTGDNAQAGTIIGFKARGEYLLDSRFSPGAEYFSEEGVLGSFPALSGQTHAVGPGLFGSWLLGPRRVVKYRLIGLFGLTPATPSWAVVTQLEFEF